MDVSSGIFAITIICPDLQRSRSFYRDALGLPVEWEDGNSATFRFGATIVNLLDAGAAPELLAPARVGQDRDGVLAVYTVRVEDVDAAAAALVAGGVELLNGPMTRPWGPRTVSFRDPAGTVWELAAD